MMRRIPSGSAGVARGTKDSGAVVEESEEENLKKSVVRLNRKTHSSWVTVNAWRRENVPNRSGERTRWYADCE